jgi:translation initiation factor 2 subunit 3
VDAPGHERLMATMLTGAAIMDGAVLVIAANETVPQAQTREHLAAADISGVEHLVVAQNKIELVDQEAVIENYNSIKAFLGTSSSKSAQEAPIIPISAMHRANIDVLIKTIEEAIPTPQRDATLPAEMFIARSFDINRPGTRPKNLKGAVIGGTMTQGELKIGDEIEIVPGVRGIKSICRR